MLTSSFLYDETELLLAQRTVQEEQGRLTCMSKNKRSKHDERVSKGGEALHSNLNVFFLLGLSPFVLEDVFCMDFVMLGSI